MTLRTTIAVASNDRTLLNVFRWEPDSTPKAIVHIAHGLGEHAERYDRVAAALTQHRYLVYANDHRGHGRTAATPDRLGFFAENDGWNRVVQDLALLIEREKKENPGLPCILLGHSMGSFLAQQVLYQYPNLVDGCALAGSTGKPEPFVPVFRTIARLQRALFGMRRRSKLLNHLALSRANKTFRPTRTDFDWLTRDQAEVDRYIADPYCGFVGTVQLWMDLLQGVTEIARPENQAKVPRGVPIYIFAGMCDPVSHKCRGLEFLAAAYRCAGLMNVLSKFYPEGRHEILNELNRDEVVADLIVWLDTVITSKSQ